MKRLIQNIIIYDRNTKRAKFEFPTIIRVEIKKSRLEFTDKATVLFKELIYEKNKKMSDLINKGDRIVIKLGYFDKDAEDFGLITEFDGYISEILPKSPIELSCQDGMYLLKQDTIETKIFRDTTLKELISYYYKDEIKIIDAKIGTWEIGANSTLVDVFDELKQRLGFLTYFQDGILHCNYELKKTPNKVIIFDNNENVPIDSENIEISKQDNFNLVVYAISPQKNGTKIERYGYYDNKKNIKISSIKPKGVLNEMKIFGVSQSDLDDLIKIRLPRLYEGITGGETKTFGFPSFNHSDQAEIINSKIDSNNGVYDITEVTKSFDVSEGYFQVAQIGLKID